MLKLTQTELYKSLLSSSKKSEIEQITATKLNLNIGDISPRHIETELTQLKVGNKRSSSYIPLANEAIGLYEQYNGRIRLFNIGATTSGQTPVPSFMPFLIGLARNRAQENTISDQTTNKAVFMNMYRIGNWSADEKSYLRLAAPTDLYTCLESGLIMYKLLCEGKIEQVLNNKVVVENLTRMYSSLFAGAILKTTKTPLSDFSTDASRFIIAKFFLIHCLEKNNGDTVNDYAYLALPFKNRTSLEGLIAYEDNLNIDYESLSGFLKTFGYTFFSDEILIQEFQKAWISMYGEGLTFAVEYVPYLIHHLCAVVHNAVLGGTSRLRNRQTELTKEGLLKFYNALISEVR